MVDKAIINLCRRSLLTQSPMVFQGKHPSTDHESLSSGTAEIRSPDRKHNVMETPLDGLPPCNLLDDKNSAIRIDSAAAAMSGEASNRSEKCLNKLESRKRKLIFLPPDTLQELKLNSLLQRATPSARAECNLHHSPKVANFDAHLSFDDDFYQDLDLDEVEAQATKILRCRSESSFGKSKEVVHDHLAQIDEEGTNYGINLICSPSFDLGI